MAKLKRYTDFADLKLDTTYQKSNTLSTNKGKEKELEKFFELLRNNISVKRKS